jgi:FixJ family two-component response regulator
MSDEPHFVAVIDDDESMCQALGRLLRLAGYDVRTYFSAESFMDDPDYVHARFAVTDIQLRGMSGFDLQTAAPAGTSRFTCRLHHRPR